MQLSNLGISLLAGCLVAGCVVDGEIEADVEVAETTQAATSDNGSSLNGIRLNGINLNGINLNGIRLNGINLNGIRLNGINLNGVNLNGINLNGINLNGINLNGTELQGIVGSEWTGLLSDGTTLPLRIDSATTGTGKNADVGMYGISFANDAGWQPLCGEANGAPVRALIVPGTWNTQSGVVGGGAYTASDSQVTFACRGKAIAKCVELGYKTWTGHATHLASCTRLLRADYCGNGTPYTADGTMLNLYDNVGIETDTENWIKEAEWTPSGARCVTQATRVPRSSVSCLANGTVPVRNSCGKFTSGALLVSELPVASLPIDALELALDDLLQ